MREYTIDTLSTLPVLRRRSYCAWSVDDACRLALADTDWTETAFNAEPPGPASIAAVWAGAAEAGQAVPVPDDYAVPSWWHGNQFQVAIGLLKIMASDSRADRPTAPYWIDRAFQAIAVAEADLERATTTTLPHLRTSEDEVS